MNHYCPGAYFYGKAGSTRCCIVHCLDPFHIQPIYPFSLVANHKMPRLDIYYVIDLCREEFKRERERFLIVQQIISCAGNF